jgi:dCTP diphosphatase
MNKTDNTTSIQELKDAIRTFREERGWGKSRTPRNMAVSIAVEAAELLEHFQWGEYDEKKKQEIANELADVLMYCAELSNILDIDIATAFLQKLEKLKEKYPVGIFNPQSQDSEAYERIKQNYRNRSKA